MRVVAFTLALSCFAAGFAMGRDLYRSRADLCERQLIEQVSDPEQRETIFDRLERGIR